MKNRGTIFLVIGVVLQILNTQVVLASRGCYTDETGEEICVNTSGFVRAEEQNRKTKRRTQEKQRVGNRTVISSSRIPVDNDEVGAVFSQISGSGRNELTKSKVLRNIEEKKVKQQEVKAFKVSEKHGNTQSTQEIEHLNKEIEALKASVQSSLEILKKNKVQLKTHGTSYSLRNPNARKYFDIAIFGLYGLLPGSTLINLMLDGSGYSKGIGSSGIYGGAVSAEAGGGIKINIGSERVSFFLNFVGREMLSGLTKDSGYFNLKGQMGVGMAMAKNANRTFILSGLIGIEAVYSGINPALLRYAGLEAINNALRQQETQINDIKNQIAHLPTVPLENQFNDLINSHSALYNQQAATMSAKMIGAGLMVGLKFVEYAGSRNIFSQGLHMSIGPVNVSHNVMALGDIGAMVNFGAFFEHSFKIANGTYLRWFVDAEALGQLSVSPRLPVNLDSVSNTLNKFQDAADYISKVMESGSLTTSISNISLLSKFFEATLDKALDTIQSNLNGSVPSEMKNLTDSLKQALNFNSGITGALTNIDNLITQLDKSVTAIPDEIIEVVKSSIQPLKSMLNGGGIGSLKSTYTTERQMQTDVENTITKGIEDWFSSAGASLAQYQRADIAKAVQNAIGGSAQDAKELRNLIEGIAKYERVTISGSADISVSSITNINNLLRQWSDSVAQNSGNLQGNNQAVAQTGLPSGIQQGISSIMDTFKKDYQNIMQERQSTAQKEIENKFEEFLKNKIESELDNAKIAYVKGSLEKFITDAVDGASSAGNASGVKALQGYLNTIVHNQVAGGVVRDIISGVSGLADINGAMQAWAKQVAGGKSGVANLGGATVNQDLRKEFEKETNILSQGYTAYQDIWSKALEMQGESGVGNVMANTIVEELNTAIASQHGSALSIKEVQDIRYWANQVASGHGSNITTLTSILSAIQSSHSVNNLQGSASISQVLSGLNLEGTTVLNDAILNWANEAASGHVSDINGKLAQEGIPSELASEIIKYLTSLENSQQIFAEGDLAGSVGEDINGLMSSLRDALGAVSLHDLVQDKFKFMASFTPRVDFGVGLYFKI